MWQERSLQIVLQLEILKSSKSTDISNLIIPNKIQFNQFNTAQSVVSIEPDREILLIMSLCGWKASVMWKEQLFKLWVRAVMKKCTFLRIMPIRGAINI